MADFIFMGARIFLTLRIAGKSGQSFPNLAAQCDIPPHIAIPFRDSLAEGVSHPFALFSWGIVQVSLRYPFSGGYRTSTSHALQGGNAQKRGRGYRTQVAMLRHQKPPQRAIGGFRGDSPAVSRNTGPLSSRIAQCNNSRISGTRKGKPAMNLGWKLPCTLSAQRLCRVFWCTGAQHR